TKTTSQVTKTRSSALVAAVTLVGFRHSGLRCSAPRCEPSTGARPIESGSMLDPQLGEILGVLHQRPLGVAENLFPLGQIPDTQFSGRRGKDDIAVEPRVFTQGRWQEDAALLVDDTVMGARQVIVLETHHAWVELWLLEDLFFEFTPRADRVHIEAPC